MPTNTSQSNNNNIFNPTSTRPSTSTGLSLNKPLPPLPISSSSSESIYASSLSTSTTKRHSFLSFFRRKASPPFSPTTTNNTSNQSRTNSTSTSSSITSKSISAPLSTQNSLILSPKLETAIPPAENSPMIMVEAPIYRFSNEIQERLREKGVKMALDDEVQKEAAVAVSKMAARSANVEFFSGEVGGAFV